MGLFDQLLSKALVSLPSRTVGQSCWSKFDPGPARAKSAMMGSKCQPAREPASHVINGGISVAKIWFLRGLFSS